MRGNCESDSFDAVLKQHQQIMMSDGLAEDQMNKRVQTHTHRGSHEDAACKASMIDTSCQTDPTPHSPHIKAEIDELQVIVDRQCRCAQRLDARSGAEVLPNDWYQPTG